VVAFLVGLWYASKHTTPRLEPQPVAQRHDQPATLQNDIALPSPIASRTQTPVRVTLTDPSVAILRPVKTEAPNVSIIWVHPTAKPAQFDNGVENNL
jgi:hypothetical protein